jgi:ribosomal protein S18 acetylase RimI-like enzyme
MKRTDAVMVRPRTPADDRFIAMLARPSFGKYSAAPEQSIAALVNARSALTFVAEAAGRPVGFAIVSFDVLGRPYGPWARPVLASLDAIAVHEPARRSGVGKALLAEALRAARDAISMSLRTAVSNRGAQALFRRAGFQTAMQIEGFYRGEQDALAMMKLLAI